MAYSIIPHLIITAIIFQGLLWIGRKIGFDLINHQKLYRRLNSDSLRSPKTLQFSNSKLKEFSSYTSLRQEITEEHKIYIAKVYWLILVIVLISLLLLLFAGLPLRTSSKIVNFLKTPLSLGNMTPRGTMMWFVLLLGSLNLFFPLRKLLRLRKRYDLDSQTKLLEDTREPILYLRSFHQDTVESDTEVGGVIDEFVRTGSNPPKKSPEERLVSVLTSVGPVVAVGKPKEKLPQLGAIRFYFRDSEWQEKVAALMKLSQMVVIQAGHSQGTEWEMVTAIKLLPPERLLFSFVHWQALNSRERQLDYEIFRRQMERLCGFNLPEKINGAYFMYFRNDLTPRFACIKGWKKYLLSRKSRLNISEVMKQVMNQAAV